MKRNFHLLILLLIASVSIKLHAQTQYVMTNGGSASTCSGTFLDPGGTGNYSGGSSDWTYTICNPTAGQPIYLQFTSFDLWRNNCIWGASIDELSIYNGSSTSSALIGTYSDDDFPGNITGTNGCLTFKFHRENLGGWGCSSNSGSSGWSAFISCSPPPDGDNCMDAYPFCSSNQYNFPNSTSTTAPSGPNYSCLGSQPNPVWYYMEIGTSGTMQLNIQQNTGQGGSGSGTDVDFALWGPFSSLSSGCTSVMSGSATPIQCSFSTSSTETIGLGLPGGYGTGASTPPAAVAGQYYIVLLTNFDDVSGFITFNQTGGTGSADCNTVIPSCSIDALTATPGACNSSSNTYTLNGQVTFSNAPTTGTLTVTNSCGGSQTFNAPFTSPLSYSFSGLTSNGNSCTVSAAFSADASCTATQTYTAPASCLPCYISNMTANIGSCQTNSVFTVTGTVTYQNSPTTGTLTVTVTNSSGSYTQTFNPTFTNGQVYNYSISNVPADGSSLTITAVFSADPTCTQTITSTSPANCNCSADIGTFSDNIIGQSNNNYILCYGDIIDIETNSDWTAPGQATNPPGPTYDPGVSWLIYSCPPSVGLTPSATQDVANDPCLLGIISDFDLIDINDMYIINSFPAGTFTNNTVYYVPITMYSISGGTYSYVNTTIPCYDLGPVYAVQYLPEITYTQSQDCYAGTASVTITGGDAQQNGTQFTGVVGSITPSNASFVTSSASNGGTITIGGLTDGQAFSFDVQDANGCTETISGTFTGVQDAGFTYPQTAYCQDAANPTPTISGVSGGTFSSTSGLVLNASTGLINLASSTTGTYTVVYTTPAATCYGTDSFSITINPLPVINVPDQTVCAGTSVTLSGNGASTYSWTGGITDGVSFVPAATTTYTVTGTTTAGCTSTDNATITVNPNPSPVITGPTSYCPNTTAALSTTQTYSQYNWSTGATTSGINATQADNPITVTVTNSYGCQGTSPAVNVTLNSAINTYDTLEICQNGSATIFGNTQTTAGTYTQTYTSSNGCDSISNVTLIVHPLPTTNAGPDQTVCYGFSVTLSESGADTYSWSPALPTNNLTFTPVSSATYVLTGTTTYGCILTDTVVVTVNPLPVISAGTDQNLCIGQSTSLSGQGGVSYTWDNGITNGVNFTPAQTTTYTVIGTDANGCIGTDQVIVNVHPLPTVFAGNDITICDGQTVVLTGSGASTYSWDNGVVNAVSFVPPTGNSYYTVTGTSVYGCTNTDDVNVIVNPLPVMNFYADTTKGCTPLTVEFTHDTTGIASCYWSFGDGSSASDCGTINHTFSVEGCFDVTLTTTSTEGCSNSLTLTDYICTENAPVASFTADPTTISELIGSQVSFQNTTTGATAYLWSFGDETSSAMTNPVHNYLNFDQNYSVTLFAYSPMGCKDSAYTTIIVKDELIVYVPNTFTPDEDKYNPVFKPVFTSGFDPQSYTLYIFNRWGELIFESHDTEVGWDGSYGERHQIDMVQDGTYTWKIMFKQKENDKHIEMVGHVNVLR